MDITTSTEQLLGYLRKISYPTDDLLPIFQHASNTVYLDSVAELALDPRFTEIIFATHEKIFVEISSRWLKLPQSQKLAAISAETRVLPLAPHLIRHVTAMLNLGQQGYLETLFSKDVLSLLELPADSLQTVLLLLYRLLVFDSGRYASYIQGCKFTALFGHSSRPVRYLAIKIVCLLMHASDTVYETLVNQVLGGGDAIGESEGRTIDFLFLPLWEHSRLGELKQKLDCFRKDETVDHRSVPIPEKVLRKDDFSGTTVAVEDILIPISKSAKHQETSLVPTLTSKLNMKEIAKAVVSDRPTLVTGPPGSGKSRLIKEVATLTQNQSKMICLHLNEQIDVKLLFGM